MTLHLPDRRLSTFPKLQFENVNLKKNPIFEFWIIIIRSGVTYVEIEGDAYLGNYLGMYVADLGIAIQPELVVARAPASAQASVGH